MPTVSLDNIDVAMTTESTDTPRDVDMMDGEQASFSKSNKSWSKLVLQ